MKELEVDLGRDTTYVTLLYGEATDYVMQCQGMSGKLEHLPTDYSHLDNTTCIVTNVNRAKDLPEAVYGLM